ncbi:MAG: hypothetical protein ACO38W_07130, partial [Phycisphaerales bacterium]
TLSPLGYTNLEIYLHERALSVMPTASADLNGDGWVDGADLGLLLLQWGGAGSGDLDGNGIVDGGDLGLLLLAWTG